MTGSTFYITISSSKASAGVSITIIIDNILKPSTAGLTNGFLVSTYYDGQYLDITDQSSITNR